jgi:hypothetical protein
MNVINSFKTKWPSLLTEPDSEKIQVEDVRFRAVLAAAEFVMPLADPENKKRILEWLQDIFNNQKLLFGTRLDLDFEALAEYVPPQQQLELEGQKQKNLEGSYAPRGDALVRYQAAMGKLPAPVIAPARAAV